MINALRTRASLPELMDDEEERGEELKEALRHLGRLNRLFGAAAPTLYGMNKLWKKAGKPLVWTVLDVGCGRGDVNRSLLRWADKRGIDLKLILLDRTEEACAEARACYSGEHRVEVLQGDLFELSPASADVVTATQMIHHFEGEEWTRAVSCLVQASRVGVVLNDIHRHWLPWTAVWLATRVVSRNRFIRHDGPLSVAKGFRADDWRCLRRETFAADLDYAWRPLFRYAVMISKAPADSIKESLTDRKGAARHA